MPAGRIASASIDDYIAAFELPVQKILRKVRATVQKAAPDAEEAISYSMPAFKQNGVLVYFAAFKHHIGVFPPIQGDAALIEAASPWAGPKGNLRFPFDQPIPYDLIERIVRLRLQQNLAKRAKGTRARTSANAGTAGEKRQAARRRG